MPTPKQVRYHYRRVQRAYEKLANALNDAHNCDVLVYENYPDESPCSTNYQTKQRMDKTMEKALAQAMRDEIMEGM